MLNFGVLTLKKIMMCQFVIKVYSGIFFDWTKS